MTDPAIPPVTIRTLGAAEAAVARDALSALLVDAVAHGASVNFMAGFTAAAAREFWDILRSRQNPKILGRDDAEVV